MRTQLLAALTTTLLAPWGLIGPASVAAEPQSEARRPLQVAQFQPRDAKEAQDEKDKRNKRDGRSRPGHERGRPETKGDRAPDRGQPQHGRGHQQGLPSRTVGEPGEKGREKVESRQRRDERAAPGRDPGSPKDERLFKGRAEPKGGSPERTQHKDARTPRQDRDARERRDEPPHKQGPGDAAPKRFGGPARGGPDRDLKGQWREDRKDQARDGSGRRFRRLDEMKQQRRERIGEGGRKIIEEPDRRMIVREGGRSIIRHDESDRIRRFGRNARTERRNDGTSVTIVNRPNGQVFSVVDSDGHLIRRYRRTRDGREIMLIDNRRHFGPGRRGLAFGIGLSLPPLAIGIPRNKYIVEYEDASRDDIYEALSAPPLEELDRDYTLEEVRSNEELRNRMRRVDLDVINFEFGSWEVPPEQYARLQWVADAINRLLERNPDEVFSIEGYTDAVGSEDDNLSLSDRRAEAVAIILTEEFEVPPENLVTQGYGEQFLKVQTQGAERANRRVAVRRLTPLLSRRDRR